MKLKILKKNFPIADSRTSPTYRGVDRPGLYYVSQHPEDHEVNQAFFLHMNQTKQSEVLNDIDIAIQIIDTYHKHTNLEFELVEIIDPPFSDVSVHQENSVFMGYDIARAYHRSLLPTGLKLIFEDQTHDEKTLKVLPLIKLTEDFFMPHLNEFGLFDDAEIAARCFECFEAIEAILPNSFGIEGHGDYSFEVIGLRLIRIDG